MRIVSLVPSHSETLVAIGASEFLVGVTKYCLEAPSVKEARPAVVGGTKNPRIGDVISLKPDFVVVCNEENRIRDVEEIESAGIYIFEVSPRSLEDAARGVRRLGELTGCKRRAEAIASRIEETATSVLKRATSSFGALADTLIYCPIWYRPWMSFGSDTYCNAVLEACGGKNVFSDGAERRYFEADPAAALERGARAGLLPTEPFKFKKPHQQLLERVLGPTEILEGSALTWYGARTPWGLLTVSDALASLNERLLGSC